MFFLKLIKALNQEGLDYAVVGGFALALHGIVRATVDIDFVIRLNSTDLARAEKVFKNLNLTSRVPVRAEDISKFRKEYIENRNMLAWSFVDYKNPANQVDILINLDFKQISTQKMSLHGEKVIVASLESLHKMKKIANRPQDQIDIENIERALNEKNKK